MTIIRGVEERLYISGVIMCGSKQTDDRQAIKLNRAKRA
jgi:hypothetical protein